MPSTEPIPAGHRVLSAEVKVDKEGTFGTGGTVTLRMAEKVIGRGRFGEAGDVPFHRQRDVDVGCDMVSPVSNQYESPLGRQDFPSSEKTAVRVIACSSHSFRKGPSGTFPDRRDYVNLAHNGLPSG